MTQRFPLVEGQRHALLTVARRLLQTRERLSLLGDPLELSVDRSEEFANAFALVGPRGAGKSTLLGRLYRRSDWLRSHEGLEDLDRFQIVRPLDCATVLRDAEPGMAILLHLWAELEESISDERPTRRPRRRPGRDAQRSTGGDDRDARWSPRQRLQSALDELVSTYLWSSESYRDLELDLASSPKSYALALVDDIRERMALTQSLAAWLEELLEALGKDALVMLLDDFDLVHAHQVRSWFNGLINEFRQANLFFVLTGDFHRLQHLIFDHEAEIDDKTARALVEKLLPLHHRVVVDPWSETSRDAFGSPSDGDPDTDGDDRSLGRLVDTQLDGRLDPQILRQLLPKRPRGLRTFYESLLLESEAGPQEFLVTARRILGNLATCRDEPLLALHLQETGVGDWRALFHFTPHPVSVEDWRQGVHGASRRSPAHRAGTKRLRPLPGLTVVSPGDAAHRETHGIGRPTPPQGPPVEAQGAVPQPAGPSQDPLRHDGLRQAPLRDAAEADRALWIEFLLDIGFSDDAHKPPGWALRNRVSFVESWQPARERLRGACMVLDTSLVQVRELMQQFFDDYEDLDLHPLLAWLSLGSEGDDLWSLRIGWPMLFEDLRLQEPALATRRFSALDLDLTLLLRRRPNAVSQTPGLEVLPDRLWAMVLWIDAIDRCPWSMFSIRLGWQLPTYFLLAGALIHGAYLYALKTAGLLTVDDLQAPQRRLVDALEQRDPTWILLGEHGGNRYEKEVFQRLSDVVQCELPPLGDDPLSRAAGCFMDLEAYHAMRDLADEGLYV